MSNGLVDPIRISSPGEKRMSSVLLTYVSSRPEAMPRIEQMTNKSVVNGWKGQQEARSLTL